MPIHNVLTILQNGAKARIRSIPLPNTKAALGLTSILLHHGFIHNVTRGTIQGPSPSQYLQASEPAKRLWVDMKYSSDDRPVLRHALPISKPSRKIFLDSRELLRLITGRRAKFVSPLQLGEIAIVHCIQTEGEAKGEEWLEARDAVGRGLGGEVIARVG
jgi:small subunit ribosomal protein S8